jgi:TRAP-type uncharacterized transport system fused permease subunit
MKIWKSMPTTSGSKIMNRTTTPTFMLPLMDRHGNIEIEGDITDADGNLVREGHIMGTMMALAEDSQAAKGSTS